MQNINTKEYWDNTWKQDGIVSFRYYPKTYEFIKSKIGTKKKVLELGFGVGILLNEIKENKNEVKGYDISEFAVKKAKKMYDLDVYCYKIPPIPEQSKQFDFCIATEFLEHFNNPDAVVKEMKRVADKIIVAVPNDCLGNDELKEHYQKFNRKSLADLLLKYFDNVEIYEGDDMENYKGLIGFAW